MLGIVCPMHQELRALVPLLEQPRVETVGGREFALGRLAGQPVVLVLSGIGKVAAAITTTLLIERYAVAGLLFTGVAGGVHPDVAVGDVVVADTLLQHDLDARPLFPRFEVPLTGVARFATDSVATQRLEAAAAGPLREGSELRLRLARDFGIAAPRLHRGLIVCGDQFIGTAAANAALRAALPDALAVEMEGGAAAQVCRAFGCPLAVVRTISDRADDQAHVDFNRFVDDIASRCTRELVLAWLEAH